MGYSLPERIERHRQFWEGEPMKSPLVAFRLAPDFFFSTHYKAAKALLVPGKRITPGMVQVDDFLEDYVRAAEETEKTGQDAFWAAEPFVGLPWVEAICGCPVYATENSFITQPCLSGPAEYGKVVFDPENPWFRKLMEYTDKLHQVFKDGYPIGQPITRGISDAAGALLGQKEMVYALYDDSEGMKKLMAGISDLFLTVVHNLQEAAGPVLGGYSMGFYHLWCPGRCIWFQEDLSSLLSPDHYREFIKPHHEKICQGFDYTAIHMHSSSFHIMDDILSLEKLKVIEINKDIGGLTIGQMLPVFQKIQSRGKKLIIWGDLDKQDIALLLENLEHKGLHFHIVVSGREEAGKLLEHIRQE